MIEIRILKSALKHGITEQQIREVLADQRSAKAFELHEDSEGDFQEMLVGYKQTNVLLEIAVKYTDKRDEVFHANRVSAEYRKLYEEAGQ